MEIVRIFQQKVEGIANYYYPQISYPSDISGYYFALHYSCLKTIAYRTKTSVAQIKKKYGARINMNGKTQQTNKNGKVIMKELITYFPTYLELMNKIGTRVTLDRKNKSLKRIEPEDAIGAPQKIYAVDPFHILDVKVNLRTGTKIYMYCCICGAENSKGNPIEMHHIKHIRKGKVTGFGQVMKNLGRKRVPCCKSCHINIHRGKYNGLALTDFT